jgi:hypothetical protein
MSKSLHPRALDLKILAGKIERNLLSPDEAKEIANIFRRVAAGENFDEILGVTRFANRPNAGKTDHYVEQVYGLTTPTYSWENKEPVPGMTVTDAIKEVAAACNVSIFTVKSAYYSKDGRQHLKKIKVTLDNQLMDMSWLENSD